MIVPIMTAQEVEERRRLWAQEMSDCFSDLRRQFILEDKAELERAITSGNSAAVFKYCYGRALRPYLIPLQIDLIVNGVATQNVTEDMAAEAINKTAHWANRIIRWWGIPL